MMNKCFLFFTPNKDLQKQSIAFFGMMSKWLVFFIIFTWSHSVFSKENKIEDTVVKKEKRMQRAFQSKNQINFLKFASAVLIENETHLEALTLLSVYHLKRNHLGLSRIIIERILSKHPNQPSAYTNRGIINLREGLKDEAILAFLKSLEIDRNYLPALANLSSIYMEYYDYEKAFPLLKKAYAIIRKFEKVVNSKDYVKIANNYAVSLVWAKEFKQATRVYERLMERGDATVDIFINYARFLIESLGDISEAREVLNQASSIALKGKDKRKIQNFRKKLKRRK